MEGLAPSALATRIQKMAESEPVTTRLGPRSRPTSSALGCDGELDDRSTAAGKLLTRQEAPTAIHEAATDPTEPMRRPGTAHTRARTPSATATTKSPPRMVELVDRAALRRGS